MLVGINKSLILGSIKACYKSCYLYLKLYNRYITLYNTKKNRVLYNMLRLFLLSQGVKSLYFTYSIVNFTALNLQGITSLHLLTTRVGLLLKSVRLFLQTS